MTDLCMVNDSTESLFMKISNDAMALVIVLIYRPPNSNIIHPPTENWLKPCIQTLYYQRYSNQPEKQLR